jgi:hypothetical protein
LSPAEERNTQLYREVPLIGSLMQLFGRESRSVRSQRAALGLESLDGRVMPAAVVDPPPGLPRGGEEIPTLTRSGGEEIPPSPGAGRGEVNLSRSRGGTEEIPQWSLSPGGEVTLNAWRNAGEEIPSFMRVIGEEIAT